MAEEAKNIKTDDSKDPKINKRVKGFKIHFKEIKSELKRVVWPDRAQLTNNTVTVLIFTLLVGMIIWGSDIVLKKITFLIYGS